jgi:hypothetical protein
MPKAKRGIISDYLPWILIGVAMLVILLIAILVLREQGLGIIEKIKDIFRGGR